MNVFITGASGRLGRVLSELLIKEGHLVSTICLPNDSQQPLLEKMRVTCFTGSLADLSDLQQVLVNTDVVYHLAAVILFHPDQRPVVWDVNIMGTYQLLETATKLREKPLKIIFTASDQVYPGPFAKYYPTDEHHPLYPSTFYGFSKQMGEEMVKFYARSNPQITYSIARLCHFESPDEIIDPNGFFSHRLFFLNGRVKYLKALHSTDPAILETISILEPLVADDEPLLLPYDCEGKPFMQELADVRDIARGLYLMMNHPQATNEVFNLTPPSVVSFAEFIPYMAQETKRRYVEAQLKIPAPFCQMNGAKARSLLGYIPKYSIFDMVDEAVAKGR